MPELPEVEVMRRDLEREVVGKKIKAVEVTGTRSVRRHKNRKEFVDVLVGRKIMAVAAAGQVPRAEARRHRRARRPPRHVRSAVAREDAREKAPKHTHVVITFTQGGLLRFVDPRTFGEMFVAEYDEIDQQVEELAHLGLDPLETALSWDLFGRMLAERKTKLKPLLMDQKFIAGIGNVYSDEILFEAGLKWERQSDSLSQQEVRRLYRAISETLQGAVKYRGSSLADEGTSTCSASPASTRTTTRCTAGRARRATAAGGRSTGPATRTARPSTATRARSDRARPSVVRVRVDRDRAGCRVCGSGTVAANRPAAKASAASCAIAPTARSRPSSRDREPAVERMIAWCQDGPPRARVDAVDGRADHDRSASRVSRSDDQADPPAARPQLAWQSPPLPSPAGEGGPVFLNR